MDIQALQAFVAVAEYGSFSRASETLFLTQPAVSKRIAQLESDLDTRLFDRIGRHVNLTEAGRALLPRARNILLALEEARRALHDLSGQVAGPLKLATSHHIGLHRLPPVLRAFTARWPEVELDLQFMDSEQACQDVRRGERELGIVTLPLSPPAELESREIWPDPLCFVVGPEHPLADASCVAPAELCRHPAVLPARGTTTREVIEAAFRPADLTIPVRLETNYLETIKMMVSVGLGWSVLPRSMLGDELRALRVDGIRLERRLGVVWHGRRTLSNAAKAMLTALADVTGPGCHSA